MASSSALLRNIRPSGGLFTENILLRLRDNSEQLEIGRIRTFIERDTEEYRRKFKERKRDKFEWCVQKWDEISPKIEKWTLDELIQKWLVPLFTQFNHELEDFELNEKNIDEDSSLKNFSITHQSRDHKNPFFHFVAINEDFDSNIDSNPLCRSHHEVCQQFTNLNPELKWLFLSNGRILRIFTKYYHTYSKGFLEFDLENIFANRDFVEFNTLYSVIHASRYIPETPDELCLIEQFQEESTKEGVKVGDSLRDNVHEALELLGNGLIQQNLDFIDKINSGEVELQEFYAELLRIIYRIIFILYAEQRKMLPGAGTLYFEQFSLSSLRILAERPIKADMNWDLWNRLFLSFKIVKEGNEFLEVPCYNGALFKDENLALILGNNLKISNDLLLNIIRLLTTSITNNMRQRINFMEIKEDEIGSIYESLLDYKPAITLNTQFQLIPETAERKSTGTYYTPKELIDILIRTTLQPLVEDRIKDIKDPQEREKIILDLKICDPACGGGTFLLASLDFLGKKLAEVRTGTDSPPEDDLRVARRDILQHCIYGVDKNPLAVELAKISLWLRACVKDKPLNFLNNHIKLGNSLIGLGQKIDINRINPDAFRALKGHKATGIPPESSKLQNLARERIRKEIKIQKTKGKITRITAFFTEKQTSDICSYEFQKLIDLPEDTPELIFEKEEQYETLQKYPEYQQALNEANIWASSFFWTLEGNTLGKIPSYVLIDELRNGINKQDNAKFMKKINQLAKNYQFLHWYIAFPEVFSSDRGGFDCILTNPPWEFLQLKEMEFFTGLNNEILSAPNQSERRKLIKALQKRDPKLFQKYKNEWTFLKKMTHYLNSSELFKLSARGTINTYALFVERCWHLISPSGYIGIITPTGIIMNYHLQGLFQSLIRNKAIFSLFDFENRKAIFNIHRNFRFCLLSLVGKNIQQEIIPMTFYTLAPKEIQEPLSIIFEDEEFSKEKLLNLPDNHILIPLEQKDFELFNPNTITCPSFRFKRDATLLRNIYKETPILIRRDVETGEIITNPWGIKFSATFHMAGDSNLFKNQSKLNQLGAKPLNAEKESGFWINDAKVYCPLYEGRMIWHFNHRLNSMGFSGEGKKRKAISIETKLEEYTDPNYSVLPNYWINQDELNNRIPETYNKKWFIAFRRYTGSTNERSLISSIIPKTGIGDSLVLVLSNQPAKLLCCLLANLNSIVLDYILRQKISGLALNYFIIEQLPIFKPSHYNEKLIEIIVSHVLQLSYTSYDLEDFANDVNYKNNPFKWNLDLREELQAELDAIYAHLYHLNRKDLIYILDTFPVLKKKEEVKYSEFRTKKLILRAYDKFIEHDELFKND